MTIDKTIFRAYDIRGVAFEDLTEEVVSLIGQAVATEAKALGQKSILIARDGRLSGSVLLDALEKGIMKAGCDVIDLGPVPTPFLYFATNVLETQTGVMLTGSHNPPDYNGLKIVIDGRPVFGEAIQRLYYRIEENALDTGEGHYQKANIIDTYFERVLSDVKLERPLKVVIDCGNGIASDFAPKLYQDLGCEVIPLFCETDGNFPNHHPDPSDPENLEDLIKAVKEYGADLGLAFDGDADRLGLVTDQGEIIWPDRELMLFAKDVLSRNPGGEVLYDVKCTKYLEDVILESGGKPMMWKTGHSFLKEKLKELPHSVLAGEMSGHFFFKERWYGFDDAIYSGARLLEILSKAKEPVSVIFEKLPNSVNTPELRLPINEMRKFVFMSEFKEKAHFEKGKVNAIDGVRVDFEYGFGLIRPSNTTPFLILRFEANTKENLEKIQMLFKDELLKLDPTLELPF